MTMEEYTKGMQVKAMNLQYVLGAISALEGSESDEFKDARIILENIAWDMAHQLNNGLDSVSLPKTEGGLGEGCEQLERETKRGCCRESRVAQASNGNGRRWGIYPDSTGDNR